MKMNIVFVNEYIGSPKHGMVYRHYFLARELKKLGHNIFMVSSSYTHLLVDPPEVRKKIVCESIDGIQYIWLKMGRYANARSPKRLFNMILFALKAYFLDIGKYTKPDVVIASSPSPFSIYPALKYAGDYDCRLIYEVRDIWPLAVQKLLSDKKMSIFKKPVFGVFIKMMSHADKLGNEKSDKVVSVFSHYWKYMNEKGYCSDKFVHIPNGYSEYGGTAEQSVMNYIDRTISSDKLNICYCGTLGQANALEVVVKAMHLLENQKNIHLYIVGDGIQRRELEKLCDGCENITFTGHISKNNINYIISKMDVMYLGLIDSSLFQYGISPTKLPEYMYSGKPVITCFNAPEDPVEISGGGVSVKENSPEAVAAAFKKINSLTSDERDKMGAKGKEYVINHLMYSNLAVLYERQFKS